MGELPEPMVGGDDVWGGRKDDLMGPVAPPPLPKPIQKKINEGKTLTKKDQKKIEEVNFAPGGKWFGTGGPGAVAPSERGPAPAFDPPPAQVGVPQAQVDPSMVPEWGDLQLDPRMTPPPPTDRGSAGQPPGGWGAPGGMGGDLGGDIEEFEGVEDLLPHTVSQVKSKKAKKAREREEIPDLPAETWEEPLVSPAPVPPGYNPLTGQGYVGPGSKARPEGGGDVGGPPAVVDQIRDVIPGTTSTMPPVSPIEPAVPAAPIGYDPTTGTGYVPPGGIPQEPAPLPQGAGLADTSGGVKPTDWLKAEFKKQNPDSEFTDNEIIQWAARTGTPNTEGGYDKEPEFEDVSAPPPDPNQQFGGELPGDPGGEPEDGGDEGSLIGEDQRHAIPTRPPPGADRRPPPPRPQPYIPPPIERIIPGGGPTTGGPPAGGGPLATRAGTGAGSGFYGEQKWFDPDAPDPAKRDIGGFSPHELPRTAADFTAAGDVGGAGLLDRMNAPAAPVQDYLASPTKPITQLPPPPPITRQEGGVVSQPIPLDQVPEDIIEKIASAVENIESFESQQDIQDAIGDLGGDKRALDTVQQIIAIIRQQYSQIPAQVGMSGMPSQPPMGMPGQPPQMDRGGLINGGGGDAMADDIYVDAEMGMNGERQKIAVSAGEYIVPGDVLAHLGSGNTNEGGEVMDQFIEDVRVQRTGSPEQPSPIDLRDVLPSTYGERYA